MYNHDSQPIQRSTTTSQNHPKTQSFPYRNTPSTRRHQIESNLTKVETCLQRTRLPTTSASSRIKPSVRSSIEETPSDTSSIPVGRFRSTTGTTNPGSARTSNFDTSSFYGLSTGNRSRPSTPIYIPSPYLQEPPFVYVSSAPAGASLAMSSSMTLRKQQHPEMPLSSQDKAKLQEWIQNQAKTFRSTYFSDNSSTSNIALEIINHLASAVDALHVGKDDFDNIEALHDIANIIAKGDITPFEMVHSGLITKLFQYLTDRTSLPNDRLGRLKLFLNIFTNIPYENTDNDEKALEKFIIELHHTHLNNVKSTETILNHLICKLHGCINQLEQFPIRGKLNFW